MKKIFEGYLLVSDMDGTLIDSHKKISKNNRKAIEYFRERGGKFTIASGRMVASAEESIKDLDIDVPAILHNGAMVYDYKNKTTLAEFYIEDYRKEAIKMVYENFPHIGIEIFSDEIVYVYRKCKWTARYLLHNYDVIYNMPDEVWTKNWTKALLIGSEKELDNVENIYKEKYDSGNAFRSGSNYFDIVANGVTKGKALTELIKDLNIDPDKVVAVGDNMNDIEMLKAAKYGFCIKTGAKRALEEARYFAPSNDDDPIDYIVKWLEDNIK